MFVLFSTIILIGFCIDKSQDFNYVSFPKELAEAIHKVRRKRHRYSDISQKRDFFSSQCVLSGS
jgi:hypothetical protein